MNQYDMLDAQIIASLQQGLPFVSRPYAVIARQIGMPEEDLRARVEQLVENGTLNRFGAVVNRRAVGYVANALVVFAVEEEQADEVGKQIADVDFIRNCCQRRPATGWPYTLYCMVHGNDRTEVMKKVDALRKEVGIEDVEHRVVFSRRCFKQVAGKYVAAADFAEVSRA